MKPRAPLTALCLGFALAGCQSSSREPVEVVRGLASSAPSPSAGMARAAPLVPDGAANVANEPQPESENAAYHIAALGDSLTDYRSHGGGFLRYLEKRCPKSRIANFGKGGDMVNQMRTRYHAQIEAAPAGTYSHLIVFGGVNDLYSDLTAGRTVDKITEDLAAIYTSARSRGMRVVAVTVAPWGGFKRYYNARRAESTHALNTWIRDQAVRGRVEAVVDAYRLLSCGDPARLCDDFELVHKDGLHMNRRGHQALGAALHEAVFADCR
jgi:lysophospholipase L1-like esterase